MGTCIVNNLGKSRFYDVIQEVKYLQFNTIESRFSYSYGENAAESWTQINRFFVELKTVHTERKYTRKPKRSKNKRKRAKKKFKDQRKFSISLLVNGP